MDSSARIIALRNSSHSAEREVNPLKTACGCPWGRVNKKQSHPLSCPPVKKCIITVVYAEWPPLFSRGTWRQQQQQHLAWLLQEGILALMEAVNDRVSVPNYFLGHPHKGSWLVLPGQPSLHVTGRTGSCLANHHYVSQTGQKAAWLTDITCHRHCRQLPG